MAFRGGSLHFVLKLRVALVATGHAANVKPLAVLIFALTQVVVEANRLIFRILMMHAMQTGHGLSFSVLPSSFVSFSTCYIWATPLLIWAHFGVLRGTSSRARDRLISRSRHGPPLLRLHVHSNGLLSHLLQRDPLNRVRAANRLYEFMESALDALNLWACVAH